MGIKEGNRKEVKNTESKSEREGEGRERRGMWKMTERVRGAG